MGGKRHGENGDSPEAAKGDHQKEGIEYLEREPFEVYQKLIGEKSDPVCARLVLTALTANGKKKACELELEPLAQYFERECGLSSEAANQTAGMLKELFNQSNTAAWEERKEYGFREFCRKDWKFHYDGEGEWHWSTGYYDSGVKR